MKNKYNGFALIEVIVSMVILSIVLASAVSLLYSLSLAVEKNRDRLVATYLAQECLELVRNSRDTAWENHHQWDCAWNNSSSCSEESIISGINKKNLIIRGEETKFSRNFVASSVVNDLQNTAKKSFDANLYSDKDLDKVLITCSVYWKGGKLSISEVLTNWRKI